MTTTADGDVILEQTRRPYVGVSAMGWFKERFSTIIDALTLKRVIALPLVIAVITALVRLAPVIARAEGTPMFLGVPSWAWGLIGGLILFIYFLTEYATRKRLELQPRFDIVFPISGLGIVAAVAREPVIMPDGTVGYGPPFRTRYVRIQIDSLSGTTVKDCVAGITRLEKKTYGPGDFINVPLPQTIFLLKDPFNVHPSIPCTVDFLRTDERDNKLAASPGIAWPYILENAFDDKGIYRFTITVNGEGVSKSKSIEIDWNCQWDTITGR